LYRERNIFNILCFDKGGKTLFEKKDLIKNEEIEEITSFDFASSKNNKILYIYTAEKHLKQTNTFFNLRSLDENFNLLSKIKLDKTPIGFKVNGENLFLSNKNEKFCTISMYNHNLEIVQTFGQENSILPFFFSPKNNVFLVSNQYFIFNKTLIGAGDNHNSVTIINRSNGLVEASLLIHEHFHKIRLYLDKFLITFNNETCFLKCYNFKGDLLEKITLDKKFEESYCSVINKELCFVLKNRNLCIF
jgi:hypothetical protein